MLVEHAITNQKSREALMEKETFRLKAAEKINY